MRQGPGNLQDAKEQDPEFREVIAAVREEIRLQVEEPIRRGKSRGATEFQREYADEIEAMADMQIEMAVFFPFDTFLNVLARKHRSDVTKFVERATDCAEAILKTLEKDGTFKKYSYRVGPGKIATLTHKATVRFLRWIGIRHEDEVVNELIEAMGSGDTLSPGSHVRRGLQRAIDDASRNFEHRSRAEPDDSTDDGSDEGGQ